MSRQDPGSSRHVGSSVWCAGDEGVWGDPTPAAICRQCKQGGAGFDGICALPQCERSRRMTASDDIVLRLRDSAFLHFCTRDEFLGQECVDAADEIDRLRERVAFLEYELGVES